MTANKNIVYHHFKLTKADRMKQNGHKAFVIWLTGLSGSGKSTIANELQNSLFAQKVNCYVLDGDNTRMGINADLSFSDSDRKENIRRVAEICKLMNDAGIVVIASFVSPFDQDRQNAKAIIGTPNFIEVFVDCPIEVCENRDVKGLYKKARNNEIQNFTGISSPFEVPLQPNLVLKTNTQSIQECVQLVKDYINNFLQINEL